MQKSHYPFKVETVTLDHWEQSERRNNFFELETSKEAEPHDEKVLYPKTF